MESVFVLAALFIALMWGIQPVVHKYFLKKLEWYSMTILTSVIYFAFILVFTYVYRHEFSRDVRNIGTRDVCWLVVLTLFTSFTASIVYYIILKDHDSSVISALIYSSPVFTAIIAYLFLKERLNLLSKLGIFLVIAGTILVSSSEHIGNIEMFRIE